MESEKENPAIGHDIIVIGTSVGGVEALRVLLAQLPSTLPATILVVIHLYPASKSVLDRLLDARTELKVKFAKNGETLEKGTVYLAPPDCHLLVKGTGALLSHGPQENRSRPAIDVLFRSAAVEYTTRVLGVVLTGMLDDGTAGLQAIKDCDGIAIVQDPKDAEYPEMVENVLRVMEVDYKAPLAEMGGLLMKLVQTPAGKPVKVSGDLRKEVEIAQGCMHTSMNENIIGSLVPFACPACGGPLSEIQAGKNVRYRCHEGHAYGDLSLIGAQNEKIEHALWAALRVLDEQANMLMKMALRQKLPSLSRERYEKRADEIQHHAREIRNFLLHTEEKTV